MKTWLICYDISDNKRRYYVDKALQGYGERIQLSAFECVLQEHQFNQLHKELQQQITQDDAIHYYPLCQWCQAKRQSQGNGNINQHREFYIT